jgi:hypothetical protein
MDSAQAETRIRLLCRMPRESRELPSRHAKRIQQFRFRFQKERAGN